jgi:hypothetical protein
VNLQFIWGNVRRDHNVLHKVLLPRVRQRWTLHSATTTGSTGTVSNLSAEEKDFVMKAAMGFQGQ